MDSENKTSIEGVFAARDGITGDTLIMKAMSSGREAAQRLYEYLATGFRGLSYIILREVFQGKSV